MWATFLIIVVAITSFAADRVSVEITSIGTVVALLLLFQAMPLQMPDGAIIGAADLLAGFANPALMTVLALLVVGQGLYQTGTLEAMTRRFSARAASAPIRVIVVLLLATCALSAFLNNTPVVVIMLPILAAIASRATIAASRFMMPLSFVAILGGNLTLIGSSTNLMVSDVASGLGLEPFGFFDITTAGLPLVAVGLVYVLVVVPRLLPPRASLLEDMQASSGGGHQFVARIRLDTSHPLVGSTATAGLFPQLKGMTLLSIQRGGRNMLLPFDDVTLAPDDVLIVAATRQVLAEAMRGREQLISPDQLSEDDRDPGMRDHVMLAEAVVAPGSRLAGRTVDASGLAATTGCFVLGLQRKSRMARSRIANIRLEAGDVLLLGGSRDAIAGLRLNRDVILLEWSAAEIPITNRSGWAIGIFAATAALAATEVLPIVIAALGGALAMVLAGCLNTRQAARAIDRRIFLMIGAALAMATALEATGGAAFVAMQIVKATDGLSPVILLSAIFLTVAVFTNILSNNATAVLFTPVAVTAAFELGLDPRAFAFAVLLGANCSFATPLGYQTNLLVMAPGHYTFADFFRAGAPLVIILWLTFTLTAPMLFGL